MPGGAEIVAIGVRGANVNPVKAIGEVTRLLRRLASDGVELSEAADVSEHLILKQTIVSTNSRQIYDKNNGDKNKIL